MTRYLSIYAATALVMIVIDVIWLGFVAKPMYQQGLGHLMTDDPKLWAAALFYLLYPVGLVAFAVLPNAVSARVGPGWKGAMVAGALFGLVAYATYDLTNLATLKGWPLSLAFIDMVWGACVSGVAAAAGSAMLAYRPLVAK